MVYICTICSDELESKTDPCGSIPCGHTFHKKCIIAWLDIGKKCAICFRVTKKEQILSPIYLSSDGESSNKSIDELRALVVVANLQRKDKEDSLIESRIANKYLKEELEKQQEVIRSMAVAHAESLRCIAKDRDTINVRLSNANSTIRTKQAEIDKLKKEAQKQVKTAEPSTTKPSPFGSHMNTSNGEKVSLFTSFPAQVPTPQKPVFGSNNNEPPKAAVFSFGKLNLGQASGPSDNTTNNNNSSGFRGFGATTTGNNANTGFGFSATPRETSNNANHAVYRGFGAPRENTTNNNGGFGGFGPIPSRFNNATNNQPQAAATPANT